MNGFSYRPLKLVIEAIIDYNTSDGLFYVIEASKDKYDHDYTPTSISSTPTVYPEERLIMRIRKK